MQIKKRNELKTWLGPFYGSMAQFARFNDGADGGDMGGEDGGEGGVATETVSDTGSTGSLLSDATLVNNDLTFVSDWQNSDLLPEELRGNKSLEVIKNLPDLVKRTIHAEKMVGKNKVALPDANATDEDWQSFFDAVGKANPAFAKPSTADAYEFEVPEGLEDVYTSERLTASKELAHKIGVTQAQFEAFMKADAEMTATAMKEQQMEAQRLHDEAVLQLKKDWGEAYPERQHIVKRLIAETFGGDKAAELNFLEKFAGDPDFIRFAAEVGVKTVESKAMIAELTQETPREAESKVQQLMATPGYMSMNSDMTEAQRSEITRQIREQQEIIANSQKNI